MRILRPCRSALAIALLAAACQPGEIEDVLGDKVQDVSRADVGGSEEDAGSVDITSYCGDGYADAFGRFDEQCDGDDLRGASCESLGLPAGQLACADNCAEYDTTRCIGLGECGNGVLDDDEACDEGPMPSGTCEYGEESCERCSAECGFVPGITRDCGDGVRDEFFEQCEADDLGGFGCVDLGYVSGQLACDERCIFDRSDCWRPICGDGVLDEGEACDEGDANVEWYCAPGDETCCRGDCQLGEPEPSAPDDAGLDSGGGDGAHDIGSDTASDSAHGDAGEPESGDARPPVDENGCAAGHGTPGFAWMLLALLGLRSRGTRGHTSLAS